MIRRHRSGLRPAGVYFLVAASLGGCERIQGPLVSSPDPLPLRLQAADQGYHLTAHDRAKIRPGFDAEALQRLLRAVLPEVRQEILAHFQFVDDGVRRGNLVQFHDATLQPLLDEVWAPMWDEVKASDADLRENTFGYPGREIAIERRAARRRLHGPRD